MASPQTETGFLRISNELFDQLCHIRINGEARQVFDCIMRKTYGFSKRSDEISLSQFALMTGIKRPRVFRAIQKLLSMNLITQKGNSIPHKGNNSYSIQKDYDLWKPIPKKGADPKKGTDRPQKGNETDPIKGNTKDNKDILKDKGYMPDPPLDQKEIEKQKAQQAKEAEFDTFCDNVVNFLNLKTGLAYNPKSSTVRQFLKARFNEGRSAYDCRLVIVSKCREWLNDEKMKEFLRVSTLFNKTKFEEYLVKAQQKVKEEENNK